MYFSKVDVIPSTHIEFFTVCASYRSNNLTYIKLHSVVNGILSSAREKANFSFAISMLVPSESKNPTTIKSPQTEQEKLFNIRGARLDIALDLTRDVIFYYQEPKTNGCIYYKSQSMFLGLSSQEQVIVLPLPIFEIKVLRSQFLLIVLQSSSTPKQNYLYEYKVRTAKETNINNSEPHAMDYLFKCMMLWKKKLEDCTRMIDSGNFLNDFYINKDNEIFFEFISYKIPVSNDTNNTNSTNSTNTTNETNTTNSSSSNNSLQFIDVYRYDSTTNDFEKIISKWPELKSLNAYRFASPELFVQVETTYANNNTNISVYVSPRRYKTTPKLAYTTLLTNIEIRQVYFDENARKLYFVAMNQYFYSYILNVRMQIKYGLSSIDNKTVKYPTKYKDNITSLNLDNQSTADLNNNSFAYAEMVDIEPLPTWVSAPCTVYTTFVIQIQKIEVKQIFCLNSSLKPGNFFFQATSLGFGSIPKPTTSGPDPTIKIVKENLPEGLLKEIDYSDVFKGSFLKLIATQSSNLAKVQGVYLDPYVYKLKVNKTKFLESITAIESTEGDMLKLYISVATKYENILFSGSRYQNNISSSNFVSTLMRDFRTITKIYPINASDYLMQVEEMTYNVKMPNRKNADTPSQGINGVCMNSTVIIHDQLGKTLVCFHETNVFIKKLQQNEEIQQLVIEPNSPEANLLSEISYIQFIKASEFFQNYVFIFFKYRVKNSGGVLGATVADVLHMGVFSIKNTMNTRLVLVNLSPFNPDDPAFLGLEFAGEKFVVLYKTQAISSKGAGENKLRVYTVLANMVPFFMYELTLPDRLALPSTINLYVTDIYSEIDLDSNQNTIIDSTSHNYQISFKMILVATKEVKVLVFNPHLQPIDSLSIIEPPPGYQIIDMGHLHQLTFRSQVRSIMILAAKTDRLDEEFYNKDEEVHIFLVSDMTPSLAMLPYNSSSLVFKTPTTRKSSNITFKFNVTSSIFPASFINNSKFSKTTQKQVFDDIDKEYIIEYSPWTSNFSSIIDPDARGNKTLTIEINTIFYQTTYSISTLRNFFIRLEPSTFVIGSVFNHSGLPQSTVEEYMGVVEVLNQSVSRLIDTQNPGKVIRPPDQKGSVDFFLTWTCDTGPGFIAKWYNNLVMLASQVCEERSIERVFLNWNNNITAILPNGSITSTTKSVNPVNRGLVIIKDLYFFLEASTTNGTNQIIFCASNISFTKDGNIETQQRFKFCSSLPDFTNHKDLFMNVLQTKTTDHFLVRVVDYNRNLQIYSQACYYIFKILNRNNSSEIATLTRISDKMYYSSNNLRFQYFEDENDSNIVIVNAVYYRWQDNTKLILVIHSTVMNINPSSPNATQRFYELKLSEIHSDYNSLRQMVKMIDIVVPRQTALSREPTMKIMVVFRMANAYLMEIKRDLFEKKDKTLNFSLFNIAPVENPFIGFTTDTDTPMPLIQGEHIFRVLNLEANSYLLVYTIDKKKLTASPQAIMENIFCMDEQNKSDTNTQYSSNVDRYIQTSAVIVLDSRPIGFTVISNFNVSLPYEHRLYYITADEKIYSVNFSSFINIRIRSHQMASNYILLNFSGSFNRSEQIMLKVKNLAGMDQKWWSLLSIFSMLSILIIFAFSGLLAVGILYLMERDMNKQLIQRKSHYIRHSLKPLSSALMQVFQGSVQSLVKKPDLEHQTNEHHSNSSEESEDYTNWAYRKNDKYRAVRYGDLPREPEEEHEPKHRDNDRSHDRPRTTPDGQK